MLRCVAVCCSVLCFVTNRYRSALAKETYEVATMNRFLKIVGLFCRISSLIEDSFAKETYNFKEPTNRSHPIPSKTLIGSRLFLQCAVICCNVSQCVAVCCSVVQRVL